MRIFAVETNIHKLKAQFLNETEEEILMIPKHPFHFLVIASSVFILYTLFGAGLIAALGYGASPDVLLLPIGIGTLIAGTVLFSAYAQWKYDFLLFTTDKMVVVDTALFKQSVEPINLEHLSSVSAETKYGNVFSFGSLKFMLKDEHNRPQMIVDYVPHVALVSARISDVITDFQRRKMRYGTPILDENAEMEESAKVYGLIQNVKVQRAPQQPAPPAEAQHAVAEHVVPLHEEVQQLKEEVRQLKEANLAQ